MTKKASPEAHKLTFDGMGINDTDRYASRIATLQPEYRHMGPMFAAAPELLETLKRYEKALLEWRTHGKPDLSEFLSISEQAEISINKAERK